MHLDCSRLDIAVCPYIVADLIWDAINFDPVSNGVRTLSPLDVDLVVFAEDAPISLTHLVTRFRQVSLRLHEVACQGAQLTALSDYRSCFAYRLLSFLINSADKTFTKEKFWVLAFGVEWIDLDASVLTSIPVFFEDLSEFVTTSTHLAFGFMTLSLRRPKMHFFNFLNLLALDQVGWVLRFTILTLSFICLSVTTGSLFACS